MALSTYLTKANFYAYSAGLTSSDVSDAYVDFLITKVNAALTAKLTKVFTLTSNYAGKYRPKHARNIVYVGTWQKNTTPDLVVKKGDDSTVALTTLTEGTDYRLFYSNGGEPDPFIPTLPVIGVKLYSGLGDQEFLQLTGTYGYSNGVPDDLLLDVKLYDMIKSLALYATNDTNTGGKGQATMVKIDKVQTNFASPSESRGPKTVSELLEKVANMLDSILLEYDFGDLLPYTIG